MKKDITIKSQIYDLPYIDVDIKKEMEDIAKNMEDFHQKFVESVGIPRNRLQIDLGNPEGDIATETVWNGNKIIDNKKIKGNYNDKGQSSIFCRRRFCN
jgi:hypothetical protein